MPNIEKAARRDQSRFKARYSQIGARYSSVAGREGLGLVRFVAERSLGVVGEVEKGSKAAQAPRRK